MKTALLILLLTVLLLWSCADTPTYHSKQDNQTYQMIKLPSKSVETIFSKTREINGRWGGTIVINEDYVAADGHTVEVYAKLKVPRHAFTGNEVITLTVDDKFATASFSPHMVFDKPVELKMVFKGIDLEELNLTSGNYDFIFIDDDGNAETLQHDGVEVDASNGEVRLEHAYLNHFSRYGFTR